jgi:diacylglycerol kinase (ATP)
MTAFVLLNPTAHGHQGYRRWQVIAPALAALGPQVVELDREHCWQGAVGEALGAGVSLFVAAGGDGTVGALVDALVKLRGERPLGSLLLGAVGLGSSNDFHKPYRRVIEGVPLRIAPAPSWRDICQARFTCRNGSEQLRYFIVSASLGLTAQANAFFNHDEGLCRWLKARWAAAAILYAAHSTLWRYKNLEAALSFSEGSEGEVRSALTHLTNLSVGKTPWLSGRFRYDTPVSPDDGLLAVNLAEGMSRRAALRTLFALSRGRFSGRVGCRHWQVKRLEVVLQAPAALELDGEVFEATRVVFKVLPERIGVCA